MLDLKFDREGTVPRDAATLILLRDGPTGLEVFAVERNKKSRFLGGALVFPGGKVDIADSHSEWTTLSSAPRVPHTTIADDEKKLRALLVAACRETLEEAAILPVRGRVSHEELLLLRANVENKKETLPGFLRARSLLLDLEALHPWSRWVTPTAEARRYDARFFVAIAPEGQIGAHDDHETMASFWASPRDLLARFEAGTVELAPPTHRTIETLLPLASAEDAIALARSACLDPICPRLVPQREEGGDTLALVLPGDPEHELTTSRVAGLSRYVLRDGRWLSEGPPLLRPSSRR